MIYRSDQKFSPYGRCKIHFQLQLGVSPKMYFDFSTVAALTPLKKQPRKIFEIFAMKL
jgi:hypothetical protein